MIIIHKLELRHLGIVRCWFPCCIIDGARLKRGRSERDLIPVLQRESKLHDHLVWVLQKQMGHTFLNLLVYSQLPSQIGDVGDFSLQTIGSCEAWCAQTAVSIFGHAKLWRDFTTIRWRFRAKMDNLAVWKPQGSLRTMINKWLPISMWIYVNLSSGKLT